MDKSSTLYVGLEVHKNSIDIATAEAGGEVRHVGSIGGDLVALDKALRKLTTKGHPLHVVYEASPCGFVIWRHLTALGTACKVVAPSSIPRPSGDRVTTDRRDAMMLARLSYLGKGVPAGAFGAQRCMKCCFGGADPYGNDGRGLLLYGCAFHQQLDGRVSPGARFVEPVANADASIAVLAG